MPPCDDNNSNFYTYKQRLIPVNYGKKHQSHRVMSGAEKQFGKIFHKIFKEN